HLSPAAHRDGHPPSGGPPACREADRHGDAGEPSRAARCRLTVRGVFVTGTGTEVGKTVVAAAIANTARRTGARVTVFKPAVSGLDEYPLAPETWENAPYLPDHALLRLAAGSRQDDDEIAPYRYGPPVSPHLAAEMAGSQ